MTTSLAARTFLVQSWLTVRTLEARIRMNTGPMLYSFIPHATRFAAVPESLLLVFAMSVVEKSLDCLRAEGRFSSSKRGLHDLMKASKSFIPWQNYDWIDDVRLRRNRVAHHQALLEHGQCERDLQFISLELLAWGILDEDPKIEFTVTFQPGA